MTSKNFNPNRGDFPETEEEESEYDDEEEEEEVVVDTKKDAKVAKHDLIDENKNIISLDEKVTDLTVKLENV